MNTWNTWLAVAQIVSLVLVALAIRQGGRRSSLEIAGIRTALAPLPGIRKDLDLALSAELMKRRQELPTLSEAATTRVRELAPEAATPSPPTTREPAACGPWVLGPEAAPRPEDEPTEEEATRALSKDEFDATVKAERERRAKAAGPITPTRPSAMLAAPTLEKATQEPST